MDFKSNPEGFFSVLAGIGALVGLGHLLKEDTPFTMKVAFGRALVSGGLGAAAGMILTLFPEAPAVLLYGTAAALASLGTSGLERLLLKILNRE